MTDIVDLWQAAADGMFDKLNEAISAADAIVRQALPENLQQNFVLIADMDGEPAGGKYEICDRITVDVHYVWRGSTGRRGLRALMWAGRQALEGQQIEAEGVAFSSVSWVGGNTATAADGVTFVGIHQFEVTAEPA